MMFFFSSKEHTSQTLSRDDVISFAVRLPERLRARCAFGGPILNLALSLVQLTSLPQRVHRVAIIAKAKYQLHEIIHKLAFKL